VPARERPAVACDGEAPLATRPGLSATNPLITTAGLAGSSGLVCVPVTVQERTATSPTEACGAGATCTTDIAFTDFVPVTSQLTSSPLQLTFAVVATDKNMTWYKNGLPVPDCLSAARSTCTRSRSSRRRGDQQQPDGAPPWRCDPPATGHIDGRPLPCNSLDTQIRSHLGS
jgi:hypothetical protein